MRLSRQTGRPARSALEAWIIAVACVAGCHAPDARDALSNSPAHISGSTSTSPAPPFAGAVVVDTPPSHDAQALVSTPSLVETWIVHTRACEQKLGSDPWPAITIGRLDEERGPIQGANPDALLARMTGRPAVFFVHGNGYTFRDAIDEAVQIRGVLEASGGLAADTIFVIFDWPSELRRAELIADLNEQARRSRVAAYHLARILQTAPAASRICLLGQSNGGRIVLTSLHLISGGALPAFWTEPAVALSAGRPDLRLRAVVLDAAAGHHWLNPGERLGQTLPGCESLLILRNCADYALSVYIFGAYTGLRPALGQVGLLASDLRKLGPLSKRVEQINLHSMVGFSHTSFPQALGLPDIPERIGRYTSWSDLASPVIR